MFLEEAAGMNRAGLPCCWLKVAAVIAAASAPSVSYVLNPAAPSPYSVAGGIGGPVVVTLARASSQPGLMVSLS
jgi:hypothetical protein